MSYKSNNAIFASTSTVVSNANNPADSFSSAEVTALQAIAAQTPNRVTSSSSGNYSTTSSTNVDVTNLSVSLTVGSDDSDVEIGLIGDNSNGLSYIGAQNNSVDNDVRFTITLLRDSVEIDEQELRLQYQGNDIGVLRIPASSYRFLEVPTAGTYTYKIQVKRVSANTLVTMEYVKLYAREIRR